MGQNGQKWPKKQNWVRNAKYLDREELVFGQFWTILATFGPNLTKIWAYIHKYEQIFSGQFFFQIGQKVLKIGQKRLKIGQKLPKNN